MDDVTSQNELVIALDIGTRYSKVAFALSSINRPTTCFFERPTNTNQHERLDVVPTVLFYANRNMPVGWGYDEVVGAKLLRFFKYSILHEDDWHPDASSWSIFLDSVKARKQLQMKAVDVLADYINKLWSACEGQVKQGTEYKHNKSALKVILTFPKGWPQYQFQQAFNKSVLSGLSSNSTLMLLTEAEAAMACILDFYSHPRSGDVDIQVDDHIIVADLGGLTADIVSGVITSKDATLEFQAITDPESAFCGDTFMTDNFVKLLEDKTKMFLDDTATLNSEFWEDAVRRWEKNIVPTFRINFQETWEFPMPLAAIQAITLRASQTYPSWVEAGAVKLYSQEIFAILDSAVKKIVDVVHAQIEKLRSRTGKDPKYLFFTGGLSHNSFIQNSLSSKVKGVTVVFPREIGRSLAVVHGAVIHAQKVSRSLLSPQLAIAKFNFGIEVDGNLIQVMSKGEYMMDGMMKRIALPWGWIESACARPDGDGTICLRICRIADIVQPIRILKWRPARWITPNDTVALELSFRDGGDRAEWAFWHNGARQSGAPFVSEEQVGAS